MRFDETSEGPSKLSSASFEKASAKDGETEELQNRAEPLSPRKEPNKTQKPRRQSTRVKQPVLVDKENQPPQRKKKKGDTASKCKAVAEIKPINELIADFNQKNLYPYFVKGDGACMFRAVAVQLEQYNYCQKFHNAVRQRCLDEIVMQSFQNFLIDFS